MNDTNIARVVYEKVVNGDSISDEELVEAMSYFRDLESRLRPLGPVFHLAANEASRVAETLSGYFTARARK